MMIRELEIKDAEAFLALSKRIEESGMMLFEPGEKQMTVEQQEKMIERISKDEDSSFFVSEIDGQLAGFLAVIGNSVKRKQHAAMVVVGVDADYRGQGVGTKLFDHLSEWAKHKGLKRLELTVIKHNDAAYHLYRKQGFKVEGVKEGSLMIDGMLTDEYYMAKLI
ncbi:GNAT family N-acetyltransferase [Jeotgalibacillus aurantiacus]|uniref:GNAT family N-acetyltransferase n=1 Tax=Jeotgalibacillus aurantiacus TaxID=2763266 RepID=UPI001D09F93C|nr:GNAT family N-acetyltransferase [Jeotgalibacillus aurantiacus]